MLDTALDLLGEEGLAGVSMSGVAKALGAPSGSVYHRFSSRDRLLAELWLRSVSDFQTEVLLELKPTRAGILKAVKRALEWTRNHPKAAQILLLYRRQDLVSGPWPGDVIERAAKLSSQLERSLEKAAEELDIDLERMVFIVSDLFFAGVRSYVARGRVIPESRDVLVLEAAESLLGAE